MGLSFNQLLTKQIVNDRTTENYRVCFNNQMNRHIKKKLSTSTPGFDLKKTDNKKPTWHFEVEGSGQRKRYLRSLKEKSST